MSHTTTIDVQFRDRAALVQSLRDLGVKVESHAAPVPLHTYRNRTQASAEIVGRDIGCLGTDIGFTKGPAGTYTAIVDDYDTTRGIRIGPDGATVADWLPQLRRRYARNVAVAAARLKGFRVESETADQDGAIRLVLRQAGA
jgi:hypothetical protein